jgi:cysteine desulfurase
VSKGTIYLDYNATTPVDPIVLETMLPWLQGSFGNPSSQHVHGRAASQAVEVARQEVADLLSCSRSEVVFTSGATEANNLALKGGVESAAGRNRVLVAATEHKSVLDTAAWLNGQGIKVDVVPVGTDGVIDLGALASMVGRDVAVVSVMLANNETGVISPIAAVAAMARSAGALIHTDATQAVGKIPVDVRSLNVDLASISSHKLYGPQGVGALYVKRRTALAPLLHGGGHERGLRSGTLNVPGIVGFGAAARLASKQLDADARRVGGLVDLLRTELTRVFPAVRPVAVDPVTGIEPDVLPNTLNIRFPGVDAEAIIANTPSIAVSTGSACSSLVPAPSHVLLAMLGDAEAAAECIRFSLGRPTTAVEVMDAANGIGRAVQRLNKMARSETAWC